MLTDYLRHPYTSHRVSKRIQAQSGQELECDLSLRGNFGEIRNKRLANLGEVSEAGAVTEHCECAVADRRIREVFKEDQVTPSLDAKLLEGEEKPFQEVLHRMLDAIAPASDTALKEALYSAARHCP